MKRDSEGRLIVDGLSELNHHIIGRKEKIWLTDGNNKYLFKSGASNYEIYAEMTASELAMQCGFETALYDVAIYNGKTGVITPSFLKFGDMIISGDKYLSNAKDIAVQNNINLDLSNNTIENIMNAFAFQDPNSDSLALLESLMTILCFDFVIMESDRNKTNWSVIRGFDGKVRFAPIYDCSTMARMNTDIDSLVNNLRTPGQIYKITDSIKYDLKLNNPDEENYMIEFEKLCKMFPNQTGRIVDSIKNLDTDKAIETIENKINSEMESGNFEIPYSVKYWLRKSVMGRRDEMVALYENNMAKGMGR